MKSPTAHVGARQHPMQAGTARVVDHRSVADFLQVLGARCCPECGSEAIDIGDGCECRTCHYKASWPGLRWRVICTPGALARLAVMA